MKIEVKPVNRTTLSEYIKIPITFEVDSKVEIERVGSGLEGLILREVRVEPTFIKDYDLEEKPTDWLKVFNMDHWRVFQGLEEDELVGGAVVAMKTPEVHMLDGRDDLALIWDIRIKPDFRRKGVGTRLFKAAADWANSRGCRYLKIDTQNTNVKACRFYASQGCLLGEVNFFKYTASKFYRDDIMFCWYLDL